MNQTKCTEMVYCCEEGNAKKFLEVLTGEGSKNRCDETSKNFRKGMDFPEFYDKEKFKRGQQFFHDNIFAMLHAKLLGLIADLSFASPILEYTNQSSRPITAYRRYVSTVFSMYCWYSNPLTPGSKSWESLKRIRTMHNFASLKSHANKIDEITQYQMALTQFGFMGLVVARYEKIGIHKPKIDEMEAFVHFWRVIGHMLGIEEKYNICRDNFQETKDICEEIISEIMAPNLNRWQPKFLKMTDALINGMWAMMPMLQTKVWLNSLYYLLNDNNNNNGEDVPDVIKMTFFERCFDKIVNLFLYLLRFEFFKALMKYNIHLMFFLTQKFPFLAYYKFGLDYRHTKFVENSELNYCVSS